MALQLSALSVEWRGEVPTLLRFDGSEYPGFAYVRNYLPPDVRRYPEIVLRADNTRAFSNIGDNQEYIAGFTVEAWGEGAKAQISSDVANENNHGLFVLEVPDTDSAAVDRYLIRFFGDENGNLGWQRLYPRRAGFVPIFSADITEVEVLGHTTT